MYFGKHSVSVLLELPFFVVKGTHRSSLQPSRNAMEVEGMVALTPGRRAVSLAFRHLRSLAVDAGLHDVVLANGTVINMDIPSPESDSIPFLDFEALSG